MMSNKRNAGVLFISGALLLCGLLAPSFTAAQETREARKTQHASLSSPQETPPVRTEAGRDMGSNSAIATSGRGQGLVGPGGPSGFGGPGNEGRRSFGGRRTPGQVLSPFTQDMLRLSEDQRKQLAEMQKEVDTRLDKILTTDQKQKLQSLRERGPGAFWGRG